MLVDHLQENKERINKIKETRDVYQSKLDKACLQPNLVYGEFKDLNRRTISDKILRDKSFICVIK